MAKAGDHWGESLLLEQTAVGSGPLVQATTDRPNLPVTNVVLFGWYNFWCTGETVRRQSRVMVLIQITLALGAAVGHAKHTMCFDAWLVA